MPKFSPPPRVSPATMPEDANCAVYIGNLDERVTDRVLYDILIQAGRVVDLYIPRDRETDKPKGYAFAEYETEEIADYAVRLFSGLVTLYNRTLKFAISGQDKSPQNSSALGPPVANAFNKPRPHTMSFEYTEISQHSGRFPGSHLASAHPPNYSQEPPPPGVTPPSNGYGSYLNGVDLEYSRRDLGSTLDSISHSRPRRYDTIDPVSYHGC